MTLVDTPAPEPRSGSRGTENGSAAGGPQDIKYRQDAASYVAAMLAELRQIAGKAGFDKLVKALDAAYYEAYGKLEGRHPDTAPAEAAPAGEKISETVEPNRA